MNLTGAWQTFSDLFRGTITKLKALSYPNLLVGIFPLTHKCLPRESWIIWVMKSTLMDLVTFQEKFSA